MDWQARVAGLWQADYSETLTRVAEMGGADLICMSPPYCDARTYGADVSWTMDDYMRLGDFVKPALKPGGHCLMVIDAPVREWRKGFGTERGFHPWKVMIDWGERVGLRVPDRLAYGRGGAVGEYFRRFRNDWEPLLWFQTIGSDGWFDKSVILEPARYGRPWGKATSREMDGAMRVREYSGPSAEGQTKHRGTLWMYGQVGNGFDDAQLQDADHPARFCLRLALDIVRCFCPPDGLVVDPFTGSGTTMIAALDTGRRFAGGDLLARPADGKPWIEVAQDVARRRYAQESLFVIGM